MPIWVEEQCHKEFAEWLYRLPSGAIITILESAYNLINTQEQVCTLANFSPDDLKELKTLQGKSEVEEANNDRELSGKIQNLTAEDMAYKTALFTIEEVKRLQTLLNNKGRQELSTKLTGQSLSHREIHQAFFSAYMRDRNRKDLDVIIKQGKQRRNGYKTLSVEARDVIRTFFNVMHNKHGSQDLLLKKATADTKKKNERKFYFLNRKKLAVMKQQIKDAPFGFNYPPLEEKDILNITKKRKNTKKSATSPRKRKLVNEGKMISRKKREPAAAATTKSTTPTVYEIDTDPDTGESGSDGVKIVGSNITHVTVDWLNNGGAETEAETTETETEIDTVGGWSFFASSTSCSTIHLTNLKGEDTNGNGIILGKRKMR